MATPAQLKELILKIANQPEPKLLNNFENILTDCLHSKNFGILEYINEWAYEQRVQYILNHHLQLVTYDILEIKLLHYPIMLGTADSQRFQLQKTGTLKLQKQLKLQHCFNHIQTEDNVFPNIIHKNELIHAQAFHKLTHSVENSYKYIEATKNSHNGILKFLGNKKEDENLPKETIEKHIKDQELVQKTYLDFNLNTDCTLDEIQVIPYILPIVIYYPEKQKTPDMEIAEELLDLKKHTKEELEMIRFQTWFDNHGNFKDVYQMEGVGSEELLERKNIEHTHKLQKVILEQINLSPVHLITNIPYSSYERPQKIVGIAEKLQIEFNLNPICLGIDKHRN
jgi:hypothetical protein